MSYKLLVLAASLLLEVHQLYRWSGRRSRKLAMLKTILKLQPTTPTELAQKLVKEGLTEIIALCKGTITAGQPTSAILDPRQKILFSKLYSSGKILKTANRGLLRTKQPSHLRISDGITHINLYETHRSITIPNALIPQQKKSFFQRLRDRLRAKLNVNGYHGYLNESLLMD